MTIDPGVLEQVYSAPVEERLAVIDAIEESIRHDANPLTPEFAAFIESRVAEAKASPGVGQSWEEVEAELFGEYDL